MSVPAFSITSGGKDFSRLYQDRLVTLRLIDDACEHSDSVMIELANPDGKVAIPFEGQVISLGLGYAGALQSMGDFVIDEPGIIGMPDIVKFAGKAAPFIAAKQFYPFHKRRTRSFDTTTIGALVQKFAQEAGLTSACDPSLAAIPIAHIDQTAESNMNVLTRLARFYSAVMKPKAGNLYFVQRGQGLSAGGKNIGGMTIDRGQTKHYTLDIKQRTNFDRVRTRHHDVAQGNYFTSETTSAGTTTTADTPYTSGGDDPDDDGSDDTDAIYEHPHTFPDAASSQAASKSIFDQTTNGSQTINITLLGDATIVSGGLVTLTGFVAPMNQQWWISKVEHEFTKQGFLTIISAMLPSGTKGAAEIKTEKSTTSTASGNYFTSETATAGNQTVE